MSFINNPILTGTSGPKVPLLNGPTPTFSNGVKVVGEVDCGSLKIDQASVPGVVVPTDTFTVNLNGTVMRVPCLI